MTLHYSPPPPACRSDTTLNHSALCVCLSHLFLSSIGGLLKNYPIWTTLMTALTHTHSSVRITSSHPQRLQFCSLGLWAVTSPRIACSRVRLVHTRVEILHVYFFCSSICAADSQGRLSARVMSRFHKNDE